MAFITPIVYLGTRVVDNVNRALMIGLLVSYCVLVLIGVQHIEADHLLHVNWKASYATLPLLFICFGFQNLVPSLTHYLNKNVPALRLAIIGGNFLALLFYLVWEFVLLGILSHDSNVKSNMIGHLLQTACHSSSVQCAVNVFSFFALITSFLATQDILIYALVFAPPLVFSLIYPHLFLKALDFAGGVIDVTLFGVLPALIVWSGRYIKKTEGLYEVFGGKFFVGFILLLSVGFLILQIV